MIELVRVQAHQIGWIDVVDADDLKRSCFGKRLWLSTIVAVPWVRAPITSALS